MTGQPPEPDLGDAELADAIVRAGPDWSVAERQAPAYAFPDAKRTRFLPRRRKRSNNWLTTAATSVDWRTRDLCEPQDQGQCNSCTAFALAATMGDLAALRPGRTPIPVSAGFIHRCIGGCGCDDGLDPGAAAKGARNTPVPAQVPGDYPYDPTRCGIANGGLRIERALSLRSVGEAKAALRHGPIFAVMDLWDDFWRAYAGGVFRHVAGRYLASHSIEIVGHDDDAGYWILKNSRGAGWGERGYARVAYGECGIFTSDGHGGLQVVL